MGIQDRDVRNALELLQNEFESLEDIIDRKDTDLRSLEDQVSDLSSAIVQKDETIQALESKISELETALAEAYLTSEAEDEQVILDSGHSREDGSS